MKRNIDLHSLQMAELICNLLHFATLVHVLHLYVLRRILKGKKPNIIKNLFTLCITSYVTKLKVAMRNNLDQIRYLLILLKAKLSCNFLYIL